MAGKKLLWVMVALTYLSSGGCCRMWDNWCNGPNHYQPAPCCPAAPPQQCPCAPSYASPAPGVAPVPSAPPRTTWQGNCP